MPKKLVPFFSILATIIAAYYATFYANTGTFHYLPFILGPLVIYDGINSYNKNQGPAFLAMIQVLFGGFLVAEHVYLVQVFWAGVINF
ncbi:hypothetical protein KAZ57_03790 [Patescibacteria group bacterium]|nr:hypothetical protein [Patescibacteria group bacterium]